MMRQVYQSITTKFAVFFAFSACGHEQSNIPSDVSSAQSMSGFYEGIEDNDVDYEELLSDFGDQEIDFNSITTSGGQGGTTDAHKITISNVEMKVFPPAVRKALDGNEDVWQRPLQLAVYLHGDNANGYFNEWGYQALRSYARSKNMLFVAALAPYSERAQFAKGYSWWHSGEANNEAFKKAIDFLRAKYNIIDGHNLYVGMSGGSTFLTSNFIPKYGNQYSGAFVINCGGAAPRSFHYQLSPALRSKIRLYYNYGSEDYLSKPTGSYGNVIGASINQYKRLGLVADVNVIKGKNHCDGTVRWNDISANIWNRYLAFK
jgi:hypothetical protein